MSDKLLEDFINTSDFSKFPQINEVLKKLVEQKIIDETAVLNYIVRKKYFEYLKRKNHYAFAAIYELAEEFNLSERQIRFIVYGK